MKGILLAFKNRTNLLTHFLPPPTKHPSTHRASKKSCVLCVYKKFLKSSTRQQKKSFEKQNIESFFRIWKWLEKLFWCPQCQSNDFGANFSFNCKICSLMPFAKLFFSKYDLNFINKCYPCIAMRIEWAMLNVCEWHRGKRLHS